jgi:argininosuccinate synthase
LIEQGYEVICFCADVGQEEDFKQAKEKALKIGAKACYIEDLREEFILEQYALPFGTIVWILGLMRAP